MKLSKKKYKKQFKKKKREKALERAWKNRDFEIGLYWKRATYFWAFIAATFTGYFIVADTKESTYLELVLASMGLMFSIAWYQVNRGSKGWQENWEKHIDMLENKITGPIYKIILPKNFPSVSKVNMKVSAFVIFIWFILIIKYFFKIDNHYICQNFSWMEGGIILILVVSIYSIFDFKNWVWWILKDNETFTFEKRIPNYRNPTK